MGLLKDSGPVFQRTCYGRNDMKDDCCLGKVEVGSCASENKCEGLFASRLFRVLWDKSQCFSKKEF